MTISLSSFANNLAEGIHKIKYKYKHNDTNMTLSELNTNIGIAFLNTKTLQII